MKMGPAGLALIKEFEGCLQPVKDRGGYFRPYYCPAGVLTIGWGHTNHHGRQFTKYDIWSQRECDHELASDMAGFERDVGRLVTVPLDQGQFDALVSFAYNCGAANLSRSTLLRKLNRGDYGGAAAQFPLWNRAGGRVLRGLVRRRAAEQLLFLTGDFSETHGLLGLLPEPMPRLVDIPRHDRPSAWSRFWKWISD